MWGESHKRERERGVEARFFLIFRTMFNCIYSVAQNIRLVLISNTNIQVLKRHEDCLFSWSDKNKFLNIKVYSFEESFHDSPSAVFMDCYTMNKYKDIFNRYTFASLNIAHQPSLFALQNFVNWDILQYSMWSAAPGCRQQDRGWRRWRGVN